MAAYSTFADFVPHGMGSKVKLPPFSCRHCKPIPLRPSTSAFISHIAYFFMFLYVSCKVNVLYMQCHVMSDCHVVCVCVCARPGLFIIIMQCYLFDARTTIPTKVKKSHQHLAAHKSKQPVPNPQMPSHGSWPDRISRRTCATCCNNM